MKLGDKDYWQVGDEVYSFKYGKGKIGSITTCINCGFGKDGEDNHSFRYYNDGTFSREIQPIYHIGAITFDEQDRPISINYDYVPEREPKVMITKLPHEFVEGEEVLCMNYEDNIWIKSKFYKFDTKYRPSVYEGFVPMIAIGINIHNSQVIPLKGNEHMEGRKITCESGKVPDDYVFPKQEHQFKTFDRVLVRDNLSNKWKINLFEQRTQDKPYSYKCLIDSWKYCIPYEGNEHLLGTTNSPE